MEALGIDPALLISQVVNFLILFLVLRFLLYKPILGMLQGRREKIKADLEAADEARRQAAEAKQEYDRQLAQVEEERRAALAKAMEEAEREKEKILREARAEAQEILAKTRSEVEYQRQQAMVEMQGQVAELAIAAASKVIGQSLDEKAHRRLIQEFLAEADQFK